MVAGTETAGLEYCACVYGGDACRVLFCGAHLYGLVPDCKPGAFGVVLAFAVYGVPGALGNPHLPCRFFSAPSAFVQKAFGRDYRDEHFGGVCKLDGLEHAGTAPAKAREHFP